MLFKFSLTKFLRLEDVLEAYHGTRIENKEKIVSKSFIISNTPDRIPNDLGNGIYFFLDKGSNYKSPKEMAESFVKNYRNCSNDEHIIFKVTVYDEAKLIDYNDAANAAVFEKFRNENLKIILKHYDSFVYNSQIKSSSIPGSLKRANLDGIVFELLRNKAHYDGVVKDTYTPQDKKYNKSSFSNGRELCLYSLDKILEIKEAT